MLSWLFRWRGATKLGHLHFKMYTRAGCHLCEQAWLLLRKASQRRGFGLEAIDIDQDPELAAQYGSCVPVVTVNGRVRFRGQVNRVLLERLLRAEERARC